VWVQAASERGEGGSALSRAEKEVGRGVAGPRQGRGGKGELARGWGGPSARMEKGFWFVYFFNSFPSSHLKYV